MAPKRKGQKKIGTSKNYRAGDNALTAANMNMRENLTDCDMAERHLKRAEKTLDRLKSGDAYRLLMRYESVKRKFDTVC